MAQAVQELDRDYDRVLGDYLRRLTRLGAEGQAASAPGHQVRTCASCGQRSVFRLDPAGTWYRCSTCGEYD
jgi:ribosomal protein L37AE/L43A